jgi:hypothetical protein
VLPGKPEIVIRSGCRNLQRIEPSMPTSTPSANPLIRLWAAPSSARPSHRPLVYSIDDTLGVVFVDLLAVGDAAAVIQALQQIRLNPEFKRDLSVCIDCRGLSHAPDAEDIRAIATFWPPRVASDLTGRCAIVAGSPWTYGEARKFTALARAPIERVRVFRACGDALLWLGVGR